MVRTHARYLFDPEELQQRIMNATRADVAVPLQQHVRIQFRKGFTTCVVELVQVAQYDHQGFAGIHDLGSPT